jgi:hypothetical protein
MPGIRRADEEDGMPPGRPRKNQDDVLMKSAELLGWAIGGLEREITQTRERLASLTAQAARLRARAGIKVGRQSAAATGGEETPDTATPVKGRKRRRRSMSPEARKRISEMMKKRWAERRKGK